ncbi:4a-hydroxytetrahydrobiopterin dehydratase [Flavobacterium sp. 102]|uniref:4a-hydroxytetrahydrobiopterin dehydratase n=1 Tax=Flavobacterium sp. 102 TaxID=2135623 RepID=UPI000EB2056E|nr:4a-hydroxytetrahydrobiopterin dehydratase [Flavobacterium sp. 102]RKS02922.1 4a-hydroxytetrahydrobiopterin dehydratase [Flavobacterium sp. 102]
MEWIVKDGKLVNTFEFKSQTALAEFILKIAKQADEMDHHPDYKIFKAFTVEITLFTYSKKAITELDQTLAAYISNTFSER